MLADTAEQMRTDGVKRVIALATSAYGSYSGCRQYREDLDRHIRRAHRSTRSGLFSIIPVLLKRQRRGCAKHVRNCLMPISFIPRTACRFRCRNRARMSSNCARFARQCTSSAALAMKLRSSSFRAAPGPPGQPWLEPDIGDYIRGTDSKRLIVVPIGFLSDHMEVLFDLDTEAADIARERGIEFVRAGTVGTHPSFVSAIRKMVESAMAGGVTVCPPDCCKAPQRPPVRPQ